MQWTWKFCQLEQRVFHVTLSQTILTKYQEIICNTQDSIPDFNLSSSSVHATPSKNLEVIMTPLILMKISAAYVTLDIWQRKMWQLIWHGSVAADLGIGGFTLSLRWNPLWKYQERWKVTRSCVFRKTSKNLA